MELRKQAVTLRRGSRRQPEVSRYAILQAALVEFAQEGLAGARMDRIAVSAGVNKALLYYYFHDKERLYGEVLDRFFAPLRQRVMSVCDQPGSAGERFLSYARTHFDSIAESPYYAHIFMGELMSASRGGSVHLDRIIENYVLAIGARVLALVQEGVDSGEFRPVDAAQFVPSAIGSIVHYFLTAPLRRKFLHEDTSTEQAIQDRRVAVLDFIAAALFKDREAGIALAATIAAQPTTSPRGDPAAPGRRDPAAPRKRGKRRRDASPPSSPAPQQEQPPTQAIDPAADQPGPQTGYKWINRWFPDVETARKVLAEESRRARKRKQRKPPTKPGEEREPK
jgi:TetR/AcrR family transcriptional regulator